MKQLLTPIELVKFAIYAAIVIGSVAMAWAQLQGEVKAANERAARAEQAVVTFGAQIVLELKELNQGQNDIDRRLSRIEGRLAR